MPAIDLSILNQRQTPAFYADILANRPSAGFVGRIFVSTDTFAFYRDNGTTWDLIGGPGTGTVTGTGANGQVTYWNGASTITGSNNLFFDAVNGHLGIGTVTPGTALDVKHNQSTVVQLEQITATNDIRIAFINSGVGLWRLGAFYNAGANDFGLFDIAAAAQPVTVKRTTGQVLIGTSTVGSGKLVVASSTGDNGVQIVGAAAPSLRIDNAESGPTKRAGFGISTAANNFIQGSVDRDFCMFNGSTTASPILFGIYDTTNVQEAARISAARNFIIGSTVDAGYKLDVNGAGRFTGVIYADNTIRVANAIIGTNSNNLLLSSNTTGGEISFWNNQLANRLMTLSGAGNLGLGVTPSAWNASYKAAQVGMGALWSTTSGNDTFLSSNIFYDGAFKYISNGNATNYNQYLGRHVWFTSPVGTAGNTISFTTAMTLEATGNLLIGTTTDNGNKLQVSGGASLTGVLTQNGVYTRSKTQSGTANSSNSIFSIVYGFPGAISGTVKVFAMAGIIGGGYMSTCVLTFNFAGGNNAGGTVESSNVSNSVLGTIASANAAFTAITSLTASITSASATGFNITLTNIIVGTQITDPTYYIEVSYGLYGNASIS